jgi:acetate kinase
VEVDQPVSGDENSGRDVVLSLNSGSSSLKLALIVVGDGEERTVARASVEGLAGGPTSAALDDALGKLAGSGAPEVDQVTVVGHRLVHGGPEHTEPMLVDEATLASLRAVVPFAPLHLPAAIAGIEAMRARHPSLPQVVCFDTAFHASMPEVARRLPIPDRFADAGMRRYGFHGLSYEYVMSVLGEGRPSRIVIAHLGNGASLVAVSEGRSIDTTMGMTPTGGILMGTRTGDLDPGVLLHLEREHGLSTDDVQRLVDREGGLLAIGGTSDMVKLLERAASDSRARLAVAMFGYAVRKAIGALAAALGGVDLLVFTGGIGEHAAEIRAEACRGLEAFGIALDPAKNARGEGLISTASSRCAVRVIATDEDVVIARHAHRVVRRPA